MRIELELTPQQVDALLQATRQQYRMRLQDEFHKDRYRLVPHGLRHGSILAHCPDMAANKKLMGALTLALGSDAQTDRVTQ